LLGLLLLPADYRAGADAAHAHSLVQLWVDAADGTVQHHHGHAGVATKSRVVASWFDPVPAGAGAESVAIGERPDLAEQHESAPAISGVHLLLVVVALLLIVAMSRAPVPAAGRLLAGRSPRVLLPPPRWVFAAA
jgi:hypothetical protein